MCDINNWWEIQRINPSNLTSIKIYITQAKSNGPSLVLNETVAKLRNISAQFWEYKKVDENSKWLLNYAGSKNLLKLS